MPPAAVLLLLGGLAAAGCGPARPKPADAAVARETLLVALEAWKGGASPESLQGREPPVYVAEREWRGGARLTGYEVDPNDQLFGPDLRCRVKLSLEGPGGKMRTKRATYSVGTNEKLTVVREDDE
jgi:hypothetical protein